MGLIIYGKMKTRSFGVRSFGVRSVGINKRTGFFIFSKAATENLGWKEGDLIVFARDEKNPKEWFIAISKGDPSDAFVLKNSKGSLYIRARGAAQAIIDSIDNSLESIRFLIGLNAQEEADKTKFYPLIIVSKKSESYGTNKKGL